MAKLVCEVCGWVYDADNGVQEAKIRPGTKWEDVPAEFVCPECGAGKDAFVPQ